MYFVVVMLFTKQVTGVAYKSVAYKNTCNVVL